MNTIHLMPGEEHIVESHLDIECPNTHFFATQDLKHVQNHLPSSQAWLRRQGVCSTFEIDHEHSWDRIVPADLFATHPEWFALVNGTREPQADHKLETTNAQLIEFIAQDAVQKHAAGLVKSTYSLSPTDFAHNFSESAASLPYYDYRGSAELPSVTRLVTKFYHDVCRKAQEMKSDVQFAGYLHSVYMFPPYGDGERFPDNFHPVLAPSHNYGWRLYRADARRELEQLIQYWSGTSDQLQYYDLPCWFRESSFVVTPPATRILDFVFDLLVKYRIRGIYIYGMDTWSQAGLTNYLLAQKIKDPRRRAADIRDGWLELAYGSDAGRAMLEFYRFLEGAFSTFYNAHDRQTAFYHANYAVMKGIYAANFMELSASLGDAARCPMTVAQRSRLDMLVDNFRGLGWWLKELRLIADADRRQFYMPDEEAMSIWQGRTRAGEFPCFPANYYDFNGRDLHE